MNSDKQAQVIALRNNTAYPTYRGFIGIITTILMILAVLQGIGGVIFGISMGTTMNNGAAGFGLAVILVAFAVLSFFLAKFWSEAAQILVDIGDTVLDSSRVPTLPGNPFIQGPSPTGSFSPPSLANPLPPASNPYVPPPSPPQSGA